MKKRTRQTGSIGVANVFVCIGILLAMGIAGCGKQGPSPQLSWTETGGVATSGKYRDVLIADLDNDTYPDIAGASSDPGKLAVWYGDGSGNMTMPRFLPFKADVRSVAAGDLNGDGRKDLVMSVQQESSGVMVWMNQPGRKWKRGVEPIKINNYEGIRLADVNQDGFLDIIAANATSDIQGGIQVWLGDGKGGWSAESGPTVTGRYMDVEVADFNKDGHLDIAGACWGTYGAVRVWLGDGTGNWSPAPPIQTGSFNGLSLGDMNGDLNVDILAGSYRDGVHIFLGDGTGGFKAVPGPKDSGSYWRVMAVNLDGDDKTDLLAASVDGRGLRAWRNQGGDDWEPVEDRFPSLGDYYDLIMGDLDRDGKPEIIAASFGEGIKVISGRNLPSSPALENDPGEQYDHGKDEQPAKPFENEVFTTKNGYVEYKVGPGDILEITLWEPDKVTKEQVEIRPDGTLSFAFVEDIQVNGMTVKEVDRTLTERLGAYIRAPRVDVDVLYYRSKWASLLGPGAASNTGGSQGWSGERGRRRGRYYLDGRVTLIELLSGAGIRSDANLREIKVTRKSGRTLKLNIYKAMTLGDKTQDITIDNGDSIYVSLISKEGNRVFVFGEVSQPGAYSFTGSEMNLFDAVAAAGGPTVFARSEETKIIRGDRTKPEVISVDLKKLTETGDQTQNVALLDGDLVYVPRSAIGDVNLFVKRIRPILDLIAAPTRAIQYFPAQENLDIGRYR